MRKVIIAGGTGFIGKKLSKHYLEKGYKVVVFTRNQELQNNGVYYKHWDAKHLSDWVSELEGADLLINLTGKSVNCRYTEANKSAILKSRTESTAVLHKALEKATYPPKIWMNASTATIYDHSLNHLNTEEDAIYGDDFSMQVAKQWEEAFFKSPLPHTRKVALRISLVIDENDNVVKPLKRLVKFGLGGHHGDGKQKFAFVHIDELLKMIDYIENDSSLEGPVNCTSKVQITNDDFMRELRKKLGVPFGINHPKWMLKLGALLMGTESELILKSRYVHPKKLEMAGFKFSDKII